MFPLLPKYGICQEAIEQFTERPLAGAAQAAPPEILAMRRTLPPEAYQQIRMGLLPAKAEERTAEVGRYEKLELRVELRATYQNPYDPDELDLWAEFAAPSNRAWKIWGFCNPSSWSVLWMVRFAPTETGLDDLKQHGANFVSFFHTPLETMSTGLGRYDENRTGPRDLRGARAPLPTWRKAQPDRREPVQVQLPELRQADAGPLERLQQTVYNRRVRLRPHLL
jgi:hypothetical protein